jgi:Protein of unknown function (DUF2721)
MYTPESLPLVSQAIRDSVAPVFLILGVGSIMGVVSNRLARAIDRYRRLLDLDAAFTDQGLLHEVQTIAQRIRWMRRAIGLCTVSALSVCLSIASMFIAAVFDSPLSYEVAILFIAAMAALILALLCFLREIQLATREVV